MKLRITVTKIDETFYSHRTFQGNAHPSGPNVIFYLEKDVTEETLDAFTEEVRQEARKRRIDNVVNLD